MLEGSIADLAIHLLSFVLVLRYQGARVPIQSLKKVGQCVEYPKTRHSPRIRLQVPVFLRGTDTSGVDFVELTKTLNISATGACIASAHILRPDQIVQLTIPSPSPATPGLVPSETPPIPARVRRQDFVGETRLFGVEFLRSLE